MRRKTDGKLDALRAIPGFDTLPHDDLVLLGHVCDLQLADAGTTLVHEGRPGRRAWILGDGRAEVRRAGVLLWEAESGSLLGDLGTAGSLPAPATVVATTPVALYSLDPRAADALLQRPALARWACGQLEGRLREVTAAPTAYAPILDLTAAEAELDALPI